MIPILLNNKNVSFRILFWLYSYLFLLKWMIGFEISLGLLNRTGLILGAIIQLWDELIWRLAIITDTFTTEADLAKCKCSSLITRLSAKCKCFFYSWSGPEDQVLYMCLSLTHSGTYHLNLQQKRQKYWFWKIEIRNIYYYLSLPFITISFLTFFS